MPATLNRSIKKKCHESISAAALRNIRAAKWNMPTVMPFTKDVQILHAYLTQKQDKWYKFISECPSAKAWKELTKGVYCPTYPLKHAPICISIKRHFWSTRWSGLGTLRNGEKKICRHFTRIVIRGKRGRSVPILLTPKMLSAIELLVSKRQACGVPKHNKYIFVRPGAMTSEAVRLLHVPGHWHRPTQACGDLVTSAQFDKHRNGPVG